ncbi:DUF4132 domain-containing protein [Thermomonospora amylolytica]|uniref:DUF4132 domain-containing protein n=1 Tax=Thermomonospora amylolytica TaxID=1411117 RepID=UPI000E6C5E3D|nr:DUF4132 domain-containing protein [Thermomonospora amylolytica]
MGDEDVLVIPESWHRWVHPRRGGRVAANAKVTTRAVARARTLVEKSAEAFEALQAQAREGDLAERAQRHLKGDADPAGAAVVALVATLEVPVFSRENTLRTFADAWAAEYGPTFAACAVVELASVHVTRLPGGPWRDTWLAAVRYKYDMMSDLAGGCARRVRTLLACADDAEYARAVERLEAYRDAQGRRLLVSYLVPTRHDWVTQCCAEIPPPSRGYTPEGLRTLLLTIGTAEHLEILGPEATVRDPLGDEEVATLLDGLGTDALPVLTGVLDRPFHTGHRKRPLEAIGLLPTDEAFQAMLDEGLYKEDSRSALRTMMDRFPVRALRMLAEAAVTLRDDAEQTDVPSLFEKQAIATRLLTRHVINRPELVAEVASTLTEAGRAMVESVLPSTDRVSDAPLDALPPLLVRPPWERPRQTAEPVVIPGLKAPVEPAMVWAEGERERWAPFIWPHWWEPYPEGIDWQEPAARYASGQDRDPRLLAAGPEEIVRPLLATAIQEDDYWVDSWAMGVDTDFLCTIIARYELDALPLALTAVRAYPTIYADLLVPFLDERVAMLMCGWFARTKTLRGTAVSWFERHGVQAARLLIPTALGKPGRARREAEEALSLIASRTGNEPIVDAAREHGDEAADAIAGLLATDPLDRLPAKMPEDAEWAVPAKLPQVLLRGEEARALPPAAVGHVLTMLALSRPGEVYPGVDVVRDLCDPGSLAEFSWELFQEWMRAGAPSKDAWALHQLGWFGDGETARRLTPLIRAWPGEGGHHKAVAGLDVLAAIGSDVALLQLHGIAEKARFKGLKARAQEKIGEVAAGLGLSAEQLSDRLVPDLGLDADGSMVLDYGPRRFTVGFDEQLKPHVTDEDGKRRKALPKPGAKDDPELASAAYKRFADLKKDVRLVADAQVRRLERAMVTRRRWTPAEFRGLFVEHPLVWHIARRLVWLAETEDGTTAFRVAEDRTFADADDDVVDLPERAAVGIAHPLDLGEDVPAWSEVFADYEILQPFPQLARDVHMLTDEERASGRLSRFEGITVPAHAVLGLTRRGWERGVPLDNGVERWISKPVPGGLHVMIDLKWGISVGRGADQDDQSLQALWIDDHPRDFWNDDDLRHTFGELDPVTASEVLADLTWLAGSKL